MIRLIHTTWMDKRSKMNVLRNAVVTFLVLLISLLFLSKTADAAEESISVKEINYYNSTITLQVNDGDTIVYFSDSTKKTWEAVPGTIKNNTITMDISWVSISKNYVITFKANRSTGIVSVTIPKQAKTFSASFNKSKGIVAFKNAGSRSIEWRKKDSTTYKTVNIDTIATELSYLYTNGAIVCFRLAPENGTGITNVGFRASKEVSLTIPKKIKAPNIEIDGSSFSIAVKKGMAYRTVNEDGTKTDWITINSTTDLLLKDIAANAMFTNESTLQKEVTLQFRKNATSSSQVSNIHTISVPIQEGLPSEDTYGISLSYSSSSTLSLEVKAASSSVPFEYSILKKNNEFSYQTAKWSTISSSMAVSINDKNAPIGSHIFVRKKSINETLDDNYALASVEIDVTGVQGVAYPDAAKVTSVSTLVSVAGVCRADKIASYLTFTLYSPTSATVSSISFRNMYGITKGTVSSKSTVAKNSDSTGINDKYIITTKITSTSDLDLVTEEVLYADITLSNSDTITSTPTAGVLLYLYPNTTIRNPQEEGYAQSFERIYLSNEEEDEASFKFRLDFGTSKVVDKTAVGAYTTDATAISSMKFDSYTLKAGTDYTVEYGSYVNDEDITIATATVTVNVASFEASPLIDDTDQLLPLVITLNNNEILDDDVSIALISTASIVDKPVAWSITEGSLKETKTSVVTNPDNSTTTVTEDIISYTITLTIFDKTYSVGVADVTWGGTSILGSASITSGEATIHLSNAKINKLATTDSDTKNIVITLSNGFVIRSGCKLSIIDNMP